MKNCSHPVCFFAFSLNNEVERRYFSPSQRGGRRSGAVREHSFSHLKNLSNCPSSFCVRLEWEAVPPDPQRPSLLPSLSLQWWEEWLFVLPASLTRRKATSEVVPSGWRLLQGSSWSSLCSNTRSAPHVSPSQHSQFFIYAYLQMQTIPTVPS